MFSGIIESIGCVHSLYINEDKSAQLVVTDSTVFVDASVGDSIAVNGACLTVIDSAESNLKGKGACFELSPETVERTAFKDLKVGASVNLERAVKVGDRLHGHIVSGHVDGIAQVERIEEVANSCWDITLSFPKQFMKYLVEKGSVTLNGTSLTIGKTTDRSIVVHIIPHTLNSTTLGRCQVGEGVNFEVDLIARYAASMLS